MSVEPTEPTKNKSGKIALWVLASLAFLVFAMIFFAKIGLPGMILDSVGVTDPRVAKPSAAPSQSDTPSPAAIPKNITEDGGFIVNTAEAAENAPAVVVYVDFICPACKAFDERYGENIQGMANDGLITLEYRPVSILDRASTTNYSSRAMNSFACVADTSPENAVAYMNKLMDSQPKEMTAGLSDAELAAHAESVGAGDVSGCIGNKGFRDWTNSSSDLAFENGLDRTPYISVNGKLWDNKGDFLPFLMEGISQNSSTTAPGGGTTGFHPPAQKPEAPAQSA